TMECTTTFSATIPKDWPAGLATSRLSLYPMVYSSSPCTTWAYGDLPARGFGPGRSQYVRPAISTDTSSSPIDSSARPASVRVRLDHHEKSFTVAGPRPAK